MGNKNALLGGTKQQLRFSPMTHSPISSPQTGWLNRLKCELDSVSLGGLVPASKKKIIMGESLPRF